MVVWGGDGGSSARAIEVRKVERKMERRVRRDRVGGGVGVSIADFFGEATEEVNGVDEEKVVSLSIVREVWAFCDRPTFQDNDSPPPNFGEVF